MIFMSDQGGCASALGGAGEFWGERWGSVFAGLDDRVRSIYHSTHGVVENHSGENHGWNI